MWCSIPSLLLPLGMADVMRQENTLPTSLSFSSALCSVRCGASTVLCLHYILYLCVFSARADARVAHPPQTPGQRGHGRLPTRHGDDVGLRSERDGQASRGSQVWVRACDSRASLRETWGLFRLFMFACERVNKLEAKFTREKCNSWRFLTGLIPLVVLPRLMP